MSKNWEKRFFTPEEIAKMESAFNEEFLSFLNRDENIYIEGYIDEEKVMYLNLTLKNREETYFYPFQTKILESENSDLKEEDAMHLLLDFIASYFDDFFKSSRNTFVLIDWKKYEFKERVLYAKGQVLNKRAEDLADKFLLENGFNCDGKEKK
jgi:hypothetical protein